MQRRHRAAMPMRPVCRSGFEVGKVPRDGREKRKRKEESACWRRSAWVVCAYVTLRGRGGRKQAIFLSESFAFSSKYTLVVRCVAISKPKRQNRCQFNGPSEKQNASIDANLMGHLKIETPERQSCHLIIVIHTSSELSSVRPADVAADMVALRNLAIHAVSSGSQRLRDGAAQVA